MKPGIYSNIASGSYHADDSLSVSGAKLLLPPSCPALFKHVRDNGSLHKQVFDFGTLCHALVLGAGEEDIVVVDAEDWRSKTARDARDEAYEHGLTPVLPKEWAQARQMADVVLNHPVAGPLFTEGGMAEYSLFWDDPITGVPLRARPDFIPKSGDKLIDYKTSITANPAQLERRFYDLGYHIQHAWYCEGYQEATGCAEPDFLFVTQAKEPPYLVTVLRYDAEAVAEGRRVMRQAIDLYARCVKTGEWPAYTESVAGLSLPGWVLRSLNLDTTGAPIDSDAISAEAAALIAELEGL